jgi:NAD(P)-dependent dehydrogenase (short-subunit alcohol dehydrogenase family)
VKASVGTAAAVPRIELPLRKDAVLATESESQEVEGDRVSLILGATGAQGSALAQRLAQSGHRLVLAARDGQRLQEMASSLGAETVEIEATDVDSIGGAFDRAIKAYGRVDAVAHCVGSIELAPAHRTSAEKWHEVIETNLTSAFGAVRSAGRTMKKGGSVVLMSTAAARVGLANHEAIAAAKAGVQGLMQSAAATYAGRGLRFNAVAPGLVRAKMSEQIFSNDKMRQASEAMHPLRRLGEPEDTAPLMQWLMEPESGWVTGQVFGVDGGLSTVRPVS